jgi:hypothetical protein
MSTNRADHLYDAIGDELDALMGHYPKVLSGLIDELYELADVEAERIRSQSKELKESK